MLIASSLIHLWPFPTYHHAGGEVCSCRCWTVSNLHSSKSQHINTKGKRGSKQRQQLETWMSYVPEFKLAATSGLGSICAESECCIFPGSFSSHLLAALLNFPKIDQTTFTTEYLTVIWEIHNESPSSV